MSKKELVECDVCRCTCSKGQYTSVNVNCRHWDMCDDCAAKLLKHIEDETRKPFVTTPVTRRRV